MTKWIKFLDSYESSPKERLLKWVITGTVWNYSFRTLIDMTMFLFGDIREVINMFYSCISYKINT